MKKASPLKKDAGPFFLAKYVYTAHAGRMYNVQNREACAAWSAEQLNASLTGALGSIHDTLQHIATAERSYFSRISTGQPCRCPQGAPLGHAG